MKILLVTCVRNRPGGILNFTEQLLLGFRESGHEAQLVELFPTKKYHTPESDLIPEGFVRGEGSGKAVHQLKGWRGLKNFSMLNGKSVSEFVTYANGFDIVIQNTPFGYACQETEKDLTWLPCISEITAKHVMVLHDGNMQRNCPWLYKLSQHFVGIACVHKSAFNAAEFIDVPRNIIFNPFDVTTKPRRPFSERKNSLVSPQTFKPIKRVENLIAAIPYMRKVENVIIAGAGIEYNYMTSKDKCKDKYRSTALTDPDRDACDEGEKFWDIGMSTGKMDYRGVIHSSERDAILDEAKFLVDSSWSNSYGEHYNRTLFECMIAGAVPIAVNLGVSDNEGGIGDLLKPGVNYLMLKHNYTPKQYAQAIDTFIDIDSATAERIIQNNDELLEQFSRKRVAQQYVDFASGLDVGFLTKNVRGNPAKYPALIQKAEQAWEDQFVETNDLSEFF
jgi:glycosyltransferase involved in cell wall biosynthesis